ncbi:WUSCHEL-related homeobox 3 [Lactuca sativa]|uniref:Homeobox domain-containing protein n=1 Tax=Lactuca sativa TaxID=4236 RepID=A0A9R1VLC3_LACSA|nr:WUSCHEL-related homeobox 3 [Lactuca sativa]KAJ0206753.1 hypothetical protein LSAT_V11C500289810 [Lactuca sativa]
MSLVPVKGVTSGSGGGSSRWSPTPEQLKFLERMYRGGLKTPSATQIQQITTRLSTYGNIQCKNVFYWFQNHKARDRQKLRKKLIEIYQPHHFYPRQDQPFLPLYQVGGVEDASICRTIVNNAKEDFQSDQTCNLMCNYPLMTMMMMMNHGTTPYCTRVPPKTLQLFPVTNTTADLRGDDRSSTTNP